MSLNAPARAGFNLLNAMLRSTWSMRYWTSARLPSLARTPPPPFLVPAGAHRRPSSAIPPAPAEVFLRRTRAAFVSLASARIGKWNAATRFHAEFSDSGRSLRMSSASPLSPPTMPDSAEPAVRCRLISAGVKPGASRPRPRRHQRTQPRLRRHVRRDELVVHPDALCRHAKDRLTGSEELGWTEEQQGVRRIEHEPDGKRG